MNNINTKNTLSIFHSHHKLPSFFPFSLFQQTKPLNRKKPLLSTHHHLLYIFPCFLSVFFSFFKNSSHFFKISYSMGKYMKKPKLKNELTLVDSINKTPTTPTTTTYFGVRTRAKTLALQKSQPQNQDLEISSDSYLQLRSRRLQKPPIFQHSSKRIKPQNQNPKSPIGNSINQEKPVQQSPDAEDADFGENVLDFEGRESRSTRESTPINLIRNPDAIRTPSSTTKRTHSTEAHRRPEQATRSVIPSTREMDEFFAKNEEAQQKLFMEKYNFDPVNDKPLPGRYEWEKLTP